MSFSFSSSSSSSLKRSPSIWPEPRRKSRTCSSWTEADEVHLLNSVLEIVKADSPSNEYVSLFDTIQSSLRRDYTREQVIDKLKGLKQKFQNHHSSSSSSTPDADADAATLDSHQRTLFEICEKIWGGQKSAMRRVAKELDSIMEVYLEEHRRKRLSGEAGDQQDFMDMMLSIMEDSQFSSYDPDTIIKSTSLSLILGGTDTTALTLTIALSFLLNNPGTLTKAQEELDIHVGKDRIVDESDIKNLLYLQAIIKETLRLGPTSTLLPLHQASEDCRIGGFFVPSGTCVLVITRKLHMDPCVWSDPCEFRPERFLTSHKNVDVRGQQFEYVPFGSGRRSCSGISFAVQVMHLTLARLLHGFEIASPSNVPIDTERFSVGNPKPTTVDVLITPRLPPQLYE